MFTFSSDKDHRKKSVSRSLLLNVNKPLQCIHVYSQCINVARRLSGVAGDVRTHVFRRLSRGGADPAQGPAD